MQYTEKKKKKKKKEDFEYGKASDIRSW